MQIDLGSYAFNPPSNRSSLKVSPQIKVSSSFSLSYHTIFSSVP